MCDLQCVELEKHMITTCPTYAHIRDDFDITFKGVLHQFLNTTPLAKLGALITRMFHFREGQVSVGSLSHYGEGDTL